MTPAEIRAHPYYRALKDADVGVPHTGLAHREFWARILADHDRARVAVETLGAQLTAATAALEVTGPAPATTPDGRLLTHAAQEALTVALTRPRSELDPFVLYPGDCDADTVWELEDHNLVTLYMIVDRDEFGRGNTDWWRGDNDASAILTAQAVNLASATA